MIINFRDDVAWFEEGFEPSNDERFVLAQFTEGLPDTPPVIRINKKVEYVKVAEGSYSARSRWAEYLFNVQGLTPLPQSQGREY